MIICPKCQSTNCIKHGRIHNGKQRYLCKDCGRQFVENPKQKIVSDEKKETVSKLLLERISLRGIVRSLKLSRSWLQNHVNTLYGRVERFFKLDDRLIEGFSKSSAGSLTLECDEMWSFLGNKARKFWIWLAVLRRDETSLEKRDRIVGCFIGDRSKEGAQGLLASIPEILRKKADFYTDFWDSYENVLPAGQHYSCGKEEGYTNHIERTNGTFRARCSRLVRANYAFSKKEENHIGAIWNFIHHYNENLV
jgi:insertion element IS1 protein InsB